MYKPVRCIYSSSMSNFESDLVHFANLVGLHCKSDILLTFA